MDGAGLRKGQKFNPECNQTVRELGQHWEKIYTLEKYKKSQLQRAYGLEGKRKIHGFSSCITPESKIHCLFNEIKRSPLFFL